MNKLTKLAAIALLTVSAGATLTACGNGKQEAQKLFAPKEPSYDKSLTLEKIVKAVNGDENNETNSLKGKIFKGKVEKIGKSDIGIKGLILEGTPKDDKGERTLSVVPNEQGDIKAKAGDTVYLKITDQTSVFGLAVVNVDEVQ